MKPDIRFAFNKQGRQDRSLFGSRQHNCIPQDSKNSGYSLLPIRNLEAMLLLLALVLLFPVLCQGSLLSHCIHSCKQKEMDSSRTQTLVHSKYGKYIPSKSVQCPRQQSGLTFLFLFSLHHSFFQCSGSLLNYPALLEDRTQKSQTCFFSILMNAPHFLTYQPNLIVERHLAIFTVIKPQAQSEMH